MSALDRTPRNTNFLLPDGFIVSIKKCPTTVFFTQELNIPGFSVTPVEQTNPFITIPHTGDHAIYEDLSLNFKVDENMTNYLEIYNWINGYAYPDSHASYKQLADEPQHTGLGLYSDISVLITTNIKNPNIEVIFKDAFPIALSGFQLMTTDGNSTEVFSTATFKYRKYDISILPR